MTKYGLTPEEQVRLLRTTPRKPAGQDLEAMRNRVTVLDALYHLDGRHLPGHPHRGTYTGLINSLIENG